MSGTHENRLAGASSPYLLLHRHNPVDWYPWGEEALARARREDRPIFLSVGYSTCYWCHVMERESFSDPAIAAAMNESFVNVKLDREERPDLDEIYMVATQLVSGQGGWPNSLFLTPDLRPFHAGTYFPPEDRWGRPGFRTVLAGVAAAWRERRAEVEEQARELAGAIGHYLEHALAPSPRPPGEEVVSAALRSLEQRFDATWGGFGEAPKFPTPANLLLLLELLERGDDPRAREMLAVTLDRMARGGLHDQLGGGFHRYATDREWRVPHFEKMLYDNGALLEVYARAWALLGDPALAQVARETVAFLERELAAPEGGFWSAIDAETGGHEGAFYVWAREELDGVLGEEDAAFLAPLLGFDGPPSFEGDRYVLHLPQPLAEAARRRRLPPEALESTVAPLRARLLARRDERPRPLTDDKLLADWNGLAIAGLATAGRLLGEPSWVARAARAADFVLTAMRPAGTLLHAWRAGHGEVAAFLADYAYVVHGLLCLHQATGEERWLRAAVELAGEQRSRLAHPEGAYYSAALAPDLLFRSREVFDGASPSPNGIAVLNLLRLAAATGEASWRAEALRALCACGPLLAAQPAAARTLAVALARWYHEGGELAAGGPPGGRGEVAPAPPGAARAPAGSEPTTLRPATAALEAEATLAVEAHLEVDGAEDGWRPFRVRLLVTTGWHLSASDGGPSPLDVEGVGCELSDVRLPAPSRLEVGGTSLPVHLGAVVVAGRLRAADGAPPRLRVRYQACDAARCLAPVARELTAS